MQDRNGTDQTWCMCNKGITHMHYHLSVLPAAGHHHPLDGTHCTYTLRVDHSDQAELTWVVTYQDNCSALGTEPGYGHPSQYNLARC